MTTHHPPARLRPQRRLRPIPHPRHRRGAPGPRREPARDGGARRRTRATSPAGDPRVQPTVQYEQAMAHANDRTTFVAGGRVTVPFKPRKGDRWAVGGVTPRELARRPRVGQGAARDDPPSSPLPAARRPRVGRRPRGPAVRRSHHVVRGPAGGRGRSGRPQARGLRLPAVLGAVGQLDPAATGRSSRPSPTSGSVPRAPATSRSATATARRRSAGAAGRARR